MARKSMYTKEMILDSAITIFKREGFEAITAKSIAKELNCSVAPIYSVYMSLDDLKRDLSVCINNCLLNEAPKKEGYCKEMDCLLAKMFEKLEIDESQNNEIANRVKEFKKILLKGDSPSKLFLHFNEIISLLSITRKSKFSRTQILGLIARHKKYITESRKSKK